MKVVVFCHSLVSDWNHGNAHFLRGVIAELLARGHRVDVHEPLDGWSRANLVADHGRGPISEFRRAFPQLRSSLYDLDELDARAVAGITDGADLVLVHEWTDPEVVRLCGAGKQAGGYRLLFHDTHHRMVTAPAEMASFDLREYDGVLAFGAVIRDLYLARSMAERSWVWHEAADTRVFRPREAATVDGPPTRDLVWIGNWGDGERTEELRQYLIAPVRELGLTADVFGVRYPPAALGELAQAGIHHGGWIANHRVPLAFAAHRVTVHVPRRPYVEALPGIPTIRPFEAMACGLPLLSAPWEDAEGLFRRGHDHLVAGSPTEMRALMREVLHDATLASSLRAEGLATIRARHTCAHRVDELLGVCTELGIDVEVGHGAAAPELERIGGPQDRRVHG